MVPEAELQMTYKRGVEATFRRLRRLGSPERPLPSNLAGEAESPQLGRELRFPQVADSGLGVVSF